MVYPSCWEFQSDCGGDSQTSFRELELRAVKEIIRTRPVGAKYLDFSLYFNKRLERNSFDTINFDYLI